MISDNKKAAIKKTEKYPKPQILNPNPENQKQATSNQQQTTNHQSKSATPKLLYIGNKLASHGETPTSIDVLAPLFEQEGYEVVTASSKKNKTLRLADMFYQVVKHAWNTNYVLIDTYSTTNFWYARMVVELCKKLNLKYITILRGGDLPHRLKKSPHASAAIFEHAYMNISPSLYLKSEFQKAGFINIHYIPNSIVLEKYAFKERKILNPKLLWVRAFAEIYNPLLAIKTLEGLLRIYPEAELCMVGPEKDVSLQKCREYVHLQNLPVKFTGKLSKQEWIRLSTDYDIFLNTTNIDNTPVSLIEAMALGLPVVSTNVGGIPFLIAADIDGILVPPNDVQRMISAVEKVIENPTEAVQRTYSARKKVESFDWEVVKNKWKAILK